MKTDNEIIAEFMGYSRLPKTGHWIKPGMSVARPLSFDSNWSELMPVVEKIEMLTSDPRNTDIGNLLSIWTYYHKVFNGTINTDIKVAYSLVVEFIKWHNNQQNP